MDEYEQDVEALAKGGVPLAAQRRLREVSLSREHDDFCFSSDLSVPEFLMLRRRGLEPLTQVMGSSVYKLGWNFVGIGMQPGPVHQQAGAYNSAFQLAANRLREEAHLAGADGVVGVRVSSGPSSLDASLIEFRAVGTAVVAPELRRSALPALSNLTGQEATMLLESGYAPAGLVAATAIHYGCVSYNRARQMRSSWGGGSWQNFELTEFAQTWSDARNDAMHQITRQANGFGASGVVGVSWHQEALEYNVNNGSVELPGVIYTVQVIATAITELPGAAVPPISTVLPLNSRSAS